MYLGQRTADYTFHPPGGSNVPGKCDANPYLNYPPDELRKLVDSEQDKEERDKIKSALKQWGRLYIYPGYPYRNAVCSRIREIANKIAEIVGPAQNLFYYQDSEIPEGYPTCLEQMQNVHDNDYDIEFDYSRQGERPNRIIDDGDFLSPKDPIFDPRSVRPRGDGPDPDGMEVPFPPTGGDIEGYPDII